MYTLAAFVDFLITLIFIVLNVFKTLVITGLYDIQCHRGDNYISDVVNAFNSGVRSEWTTAHFMTSLESSIKESGSPSLALLLRRMRHSNPYSIRSVDFEQYDDFVQFTLPMLLVLSIQLKTMMHAESLDRLLLNTRDGCLLEVLFDLLLSEGELNFTVHRFHSSRLVGAYPTDEYINYVKEMYLENKTMIFDLVNYYNSTAFTTPTFFMLIILHNQTFVSARKLQEPPEPV